MDHAYERGWVRYRFSEIDFETRTIHGSSVPIRVKNLFNRGPGRAHISAGEVPRDPTDAEAIGMHIHRDVPTGTDVEEWYIVISGEGIMTFSNGDEVPVGPGDFVVAYPGTGHSFRTVSEDPVRLISITPVMYTNATPVTRYPDGFDPSIEVGEVNEVMNPINARCAACGEEWQRHPDDDASTGLASWAGSHECGT